METTVLALAEDLGRIVGTVQAKADTLLEKRAGVTQRLVQIRDTASHMLSELGHQVNSGYETVAGTVAGALSTPTRKKSKRAQAIKKKVAATRANARPAPAAAVVVSSRKARVEKGEEASRRVSAKTRAQHAVTGKQRRAPR